MCILKPYKYEGKSISDSAKAQKDVHAEMNYYAGLLEELAKGKVWLLVANDWTFPVAQW